MSLLESSSIWSLAPLSLYMLMIYKLEEDHAVRVSWSSVMYPSTPALSPIVLRRVSMDRLKSNAINKRPASLTL